MTERTKEAAGLLRVVAGIIFFIGMVIGLILIIIGVMSVVSGNNSIANGFFKTTGVLLIIYGLITILWHAIAYAILNGFSVIIENSDRTELKNALYEMSDRIAGEKTSYRRGFKEGTDYQDENTYDVE